MNGDGSTEHDEIVLVSHCKGGTLHGDMWQKPQDYGYRQSRLTFFRNTALEEQWKHQTQERTEASNDAPLSDGLWQQMQEREASYGDQAKPIEHREHGPILCSSYQKWASEEGDDRGGKEQISLSHERPRIEIP